MLACHFDQYEQNLQRVSKKTSADASISARVAALGGTVVMEGDAVVRIDLHGTGKVTEDEVEAGIRKVMDLSPSGIRRHLDLNKPIYAKTSAYGHFGRKAGRDGSFSWEKLDLVKPLKDALKA